MPRFGAEASEAGLPAADLKLPQLSTEMAISLRLYMAYIHIYLCLYRYAWRACDMSYGML